MITAAERLLSRMLGMPAQQVREVVQRWEKQIKDGADTVAASYLNAGWEEVETEDAALPDGREVLRVGDRSFVMPLEQHEQRLREAFDAARKQERTPPAGEALASVLCPIDHAIMDKRPVCPSCAKGKAGYKLLLTCTECGHEVFL